MSDSYDTGGCPLPSHGILREEHQHILQRSDTLISDAGKKCGGGANFPGSYGKRFDYF